VAAAAAAAVCDLELRGRPQYGLTAHTAVVAATAAAAAAAAAHAASKKVAIQ
jgi:hypothetical protein